MGLAPNEIELAYRLLLQRPPSEAEVANAARQHTDLQSLRQVFLHSEEFYRKFKVLREAFEARQRPILVHPLILETSGQTLLEALDTAPELHPSRQTDEDGIAPVRQLPRPDRLKLRLVQGDLSFAAGTELEVPYLTLCVLRRPGPRLWRLWKFFCPSESPEPTEQSDEPPAMGFGEFLEYSLNSVPHRLEVDNGQVRRLAGALNEDGFGAEPALLRRALHVALSEDTVLGLAEDPTGLLHALAAKNLIAPPDAALPEDFDDMASLDQDLAALTEGQQRIFDGYTAWDNYLYEVCAGLLASSEDTQTIG